MSSGCNCRTRVPTVSSSSPAAAGITTTGATGVRLGAAAAVTRVGWVSDASLVAAGWLSGTFRAVRWAIVGSTTGTATGTGSEVMAGVVTRVGAPVVVGTVASDSAFPWATCSVGATASIRPWLVDGLVGSGSGSLRAAVE